MAAGNAPVAGGSGTVVGKAMAGGNGGRVGNGAMVGKAVAGGSGGRVGNGVAGSSGAMVGNGVAAGNSVAAGKGGSVGRGATTAAVAAGSGVRPKPGEEPQPASSNAAVNKAKPVKKRISNYPVKLCYDYPHE